MKNTKLNVKLWRFKDEVIEVDYTSQEYPHPLRIITYILLCNHLLQMIFLKNFFDENMRVNTKNQWVWAIHLISYSIVIY